MDFRDPSLIALPTTYDEFERFCLLIARERYGSEFYRYARSGQAQHGIDIYSGYYNGRCLQCKLYKKEVSDAYLLTKLNEDLKDAQKQFDDLKQFIFAISVETRPVIQHACKKLSDDKIQVIPWFWNQLQEDIARSKWLLRYCLDYEPGAQWISDHFVEQQCSKGCAANWQPLQFYSGNTNVQWYGLLQNWDAPREHYAAIRRVLADSFADTYSDMPVSGVVRGEGGSGKSVLLRRLALDLRSEYTVYWIADNAMDFLQNEWLYDIDNNPTEKYLIVLEDWYRNFSSTGDRATANRLLQKIKSKANVRLLIGDRPAQFTYYPKNDSVVFDLQNDENAALLSYIINIVPDWKDKFTDEQKAQLVKTGIFQLLFTYQYAVTGKPMVKSENYFLELIQSDYRQLINTDFPFYKGLAHALYVYAHLYTGLGIHLSPDALVVLAETYSGAQRPFELRQDIRTIANDPVVKKYLAIVSYDTFLFGKFERLTFLHDTLADQGWKHVPVNNRSFFGSPASISQLFDALKTEETAYDLSELLYRILRTNQAVLSREQILTYCDFLVAIRCESYSYVQAIFTEDLTNLSDTQRLGYLQRLIGLGNQSLSFWSKILAWMGKRLSEQDRKDILAKLVIAGNKCDQVVGSFFRSLSQTELKEKVEDSFTIESLLDPSQQSRVSAFLKRLAHDEIILKVIRKYLQSPEPQKAFQNFTVCLNLLKEEDVAKEAARKYLQSPASERVTPNFVVCLNVLGVEVADRVARILQSPLEGQDQRVIYRALQIASESEKLYHVAEDTVQRILEAKPVGCDRASQKEYYLYMQMMKVPLFEIKPWQAEVDRILRKGLYIHRNLFYSLTLSHINKPDPLADLCLLLIRNWLPEFMRQQRYWGYFIRSLAHPIIISQFAVKKEICQLCRQMLLAHSCPSELKGWLKSIVEENQFPLWKITEGDEL